MAIQNVVERFMAELDSNPALLEAVRARLQTRELLDLPERFDSLESTLQRFMESTERRFEALEGRFGVMEGHLNSLRGDNLERRLQGRIHAIMASGYGLFGVEIVRAAFPPGTLPEFLRDVENAYFDGIIDQAQYARLFDTDMIARARRERNRDEVAYIGVEVANQLDARDVERVVDTGVILARMFPHSEIVTVVYGRSISEQDEALAKAKGVDVILTSASR